MTDEPDLTERQAQVLRALMAEKLAADIDPSEVGGLADDELARQLGVCEDEIRHDIQALIDRGYIEHGPAESAMDDDWFRQVECDWQWPDGRYCNTREPRLRDNGTRAGVCCSAAQRLRLWMLPGGREGLASSSAVPPCPLVSSECNWERRDG
jgi:hypothetical protein